MPSLDEAAQRLAQLLTGDGDEYSDPSGGDLEFLDEVAPRPLEPMPAPPDCWAVDGGQALVADARCFQVAMTRAARTRWQEGTCTLEEQTAVSVHVLTGADGGPEARRSLAEAAAPVAPGSPVDLNLLRDWSEWALVADSVDHAERGGVVLVDGDLQPDWRVAAHWLAALFERASARGVTLVGLTKHSSLARGNAPLVGRLELEAERVLGARARWWAPVGTRRREVGPGLLVVVARLDPDARFAFRVDLPLGPGPEAVLGALCALSDDAAFPGYPYPLSAADRLAACSGWDRARFRSDLGTALEAAGVAPEVSERAFADRHRLMER